MKKNILTILILFLGHLSFGQIELGVSKDGVSAPKLWMESNVFTFGKIPLGIPVSISFELKNTGNAPLLFTKVEPSCNCTLLEYTKTEILPGQLGFVKATYDAKILGKFDKRIFVSSNAFEGAMDLILTGEVIYIKE